MFRHYQDIRRLRRGPAPSVLLLHGRINAQVGPSVSQSVSQTIRDSVRSSECGKLSGIIVCRNRHQSSACIETDTIAKKPVDLLDSIMFPHIIVQQICGLLVLSILLVLLPLYHILLSMWHRCRRMYVSTLLLISRGEMSVKASK